MQTQKYHVEYVENCCGKVKEFKTREDLEIWLKTFSAETGSNWIKSVYYGVKITIHSGYYITT